MRVISNTCLAATRWSQFAPLKAEPSPLELVLMETLSNHRRRTIQTPQCRMDCGFSGAVQ